MNESKCSKMPLTDRFWSKVKIGSTDQCWEWQAGRNPKGYGQFMSERPGRPILAHRQAWELTHGKVENGLHVLHSCDHPWCCNPAHLWLGTNAQNHADKMSKGRASGPRGDRHASVKLTSDDVRAIRALAVAGVSTRSIAQQHGISTVMVRYIVVRKSWVHVT